MTFQMAKAIIFNLILFAAVAGRCIAQQTPMAVSVAQPIETETADLDFVGRLEPATTADVRAAVDGDVRQVLVRDEELVTEGQLLVQLDDHGIQRQVDTANAELGKLKAELDQLKKKSDADSAENAAAQALAAANMQIKEVELQQLCDELDETKITAPLAGRIVQLSLKEGDAVMSSPSSATLVCKITQTNPVRACFDVDPLTLNQLRKLQHGTTEQSTEAESKQPLAGTFSLATSGEQEFKHIGSLDYLGSRADSQTGQVRVCAVFPNADRTLDAAALAKVDKDRRVRVRFALQLPQKVLLVTSLAVGRDEERRNFVFVVDDKNHIAARTVTLGAQHQGLQIIESGLSADEWVVIGTPTTKLNPGDQPFSPIDFNSDLRFGNLRAGVTVVPVKTLMPRPGKTLRDRTREEIQQQKATAK
jgi:RND family efflux transporter MFP subunit